MRRPVEDFESVFRAVSKQTKDPIVLVGGHAVNVWALTYQDRLGEALKRYQPLTSGDMDFYATRNSLLALHRELGGKLLLSGPREITDGTLILGVEPDTREIDILRSINGLSRIRTQDTITLKICGYDIPVLFPHLLLQAKIANALHLQQAERQDIKHVGVLALVLREFLSEVVNSATGSDEKPALTLLQRSLKVLISDDAREFSRRHSHTFADVMPANVLGRLAPSPLGSIWTGISISAPASLGSARPKACLTSF